VDVSTVDVDTSKLINGHIKSTGALFLEVSLFILSLSILHEHAGYSLIWIWIISYMIYLDG